MQPDPVGQVPDDGLTARELGCSRRWRKACRTPKIASPATRFRGDGEDPTSITCWQDRRRDAPDRWPTRPHRTCRLSLAVFRHRCLGEPGRFGGVRREKRAAAGTGQGARDLIPGGRIDRLETGRIDHRGCRHGARRKRPLWSKGGQGAAAPGEGQPSSLRPFWSTLQPVRRCAADWRCAPPNAERRRARA